jgi:hypothetical protein
VITHVAALRVHQYVPAWQDVVLNCQAYACVEQNKIHTCKPAIAHTVRDGAPFVASHFEDSAAQLTLRDFRKVLNLPGKLAIQL